MSYYKLKMRFAAWINTIVEKGKGRVLILSEIENQAEIDFGFSQKQVLLAFDRFERQGLVEVDIKNDKVRVMVDDKKGKGKKD